MCFFYWIKCVQIVGQYIGIEQGFIQCCQYVCIIVDIMQDYVLIQESDVCCFELCQGLLGGGVDFGWVIDVQYYDYLEVGVVQSGQ